MSFKFKINKEAIPYETSLIIGKKEYTLKFKYNSYDDRVYVDLYDNKGNVIELSCPINFGIPFWYNKLTDERGNFNEKYPYACLIPNTKDKKIKKITYSNIDEIEILVKEFENE